MPRQTFNELFQSITAAPTAVANTASETILVPDFVFPAGFFIQGTTVRATLMGRVSNVVTAVPTQTIKVHVGTATLSATAVFSSPALSANATANTNLTWRMEYTMTCRTSGTAGTLMCAGQIWLPNLTAGSALGQVGYPTMFPVTAPATGTLDTTVANVLSLGWTWSAANASNSVQAELYHLESNN